MTSPVMPGGWFTPTGGRPGNSGILSSGSMSEPPGMREALDAMADQWRKQADFDMEIKRKDLDLRVQALQQQGRTAEAAAENARGQLELAKQRLAWEKEIETKKFNLSRAQATAEFMSGPDMLFLGQDFMSSLERAGLGAGPAPLTAMGSPRQRTYGDFEAAENGTWNGANSGTAVGGQQAFPTLQRGDQPAPTAGADGKPPPDPRIAAANSVMKAIPPSGSPGTDANDQAALAAVVNIYRAGLPGTLAKMRPGQQKAFAAGLSRAGYYAPDAIADMRRAQPGQGNVRAA